MSRCTLELDTRAWTLREPFVISRGTLTESRSLLVTLRSGQHTARGEACGIRYKGETPARMRAQIESIRPSIEAGVDRYTLQTLLPAGGARNAVDAALWDLESRESGRPVGVLAGLGPAGPLVTAITIGIRPVPEYETRARALADCPWIKIKVDNEKPVEAVAAVRSGAPNARLIVDANQAWSVSQLVHFTPQLASLGVDLLEQPIRGDDDAALAELELPVPICADEPASTAADLPRLVGRYDFVNIKLDKSGGLTAALELARAARDAGLRLMVGCMIDSSLAIAPAVLLAQLCDVVDLDGPLLLADDWADGVRYRAGKITPPARGFWG